MKKRITYTQLLKTLHYSKSTGYFIWRISGHKKKLGKRAGWKGDSGHILICVNYRIYRAHQLAWLYVTGKWPREEIDHKNRVGDDNRWKNLREATHAQNTENVTKRTGTTSRFLGVTFDKARSLWSAQMHINGRHIYVGRFENEKDAARARDRKVNELGLIWRGLNFGRGHRALSRQ